MAKILTNTAAGAKPSLLIVVLTSVLCSVVTSVGMFYALSGGGGMAAIANTMCVAMLLPCFTQQRQPFHVPALTASRVRRSCCPSTEAVPPTVHRGLCHRLGRPPMGRVRGMA